MWVWLAIFVALAILEGVTYSLVSIWFCFGALAGLIAAAFNAPVWAQILCFVFVGALALFTLRAYVQNKIALKPLKTNLDRLAGMTGVVIEETGAWSGAVRADGTEWNARSSTEAVIPVGAQCRIVRLDGNKLIVELVSGNQQLNNKEGHTE